MKLFAVDKIFVILTVHKCCRRACLEYAAFRTL